MTLQFIHDNRGNTTGVFIPIEDRQSLKLKYSDLNIEEVENTYNFQRGIRNYLMND